MEKQSLLELVPNLSAEDVKPDSDGVQFVIKADPAQNENAGKARMFTLVQLQHLFNV